MIDEYCKALIKDWYERIKYDMNHLISNYGIKIPETIKVLEEMKVHMDESE
jgi:hypothetical protein